MSTRVRESCAIRYHALRFFSVQHWGRGYTEVQENIPQVANIITSILSNITGSCTAAEHEICCEGSNCAGQPVANCYCDFDCHFFDDCCHDINDICSWDGTLAKLRNSIRAKATSVEPCLTIFELVVSRTFVALVKV